MRDLNYQLKQCCQRNRDGSFATQNKRRHLSLELQRAFDLRLEEAIKFTPSFAGRGDFSPLPQS